MRRSMVRLALVAVFLAALPATATAGGWATVRLDEPPGDVQAGVPWTVGFTVRAHDVTPVDVEAARLMARHRETGREVAASGRREGNVGHYVAEVTFPGAGEWTWSIAPDPYAATTFEALTVVDDVGAAVMERRSTFAARVGAVRLFEGRCPVAGAGVMATEEIPLTLVASSPELKHLGEDGARPVVRQVADGDVALADLLDGGHAVAVERPGGNGLVACGLVGGPYDGTELVVGLVGTTDADPGGVAVLRGKGAATEVRVYVTGGGGAPAAAGANGVNGPTATEEIVGSAFSPPELRVDAGTTVTWVNTDEVAHTVTGDDLAFEDSGLLAPGQRFGKTFDTPGVYRYRCGPHPSMVATIMVG